MCGDREYMKIPLPSPQFCYEPKTSLKSKSIKNKVKGGPIGPFTYLQLCKILRD